MFCQQGKLNAHYPCADSIVACLSTPRADLYIPSGNNLSALVPCAQGQVASFDWTYCVSCIPGSYADGSPIIRSLSASHPPAANATCPWCPVGTFANSSGTIRCSLCPPSTYNAQVGVTACASCPPGKQCPVWGANASQPCPPGTFGAVSRLSSCTLCANNTVQYDRGMTACDACDTANGLYSPYPGGTRCQYCNGTMSNGGDCDACPLGKYFQSLPTRHCQA